MARESTQKKITRVRPPRVHITYDVEIGDAIKAKEIPMVVGVLADLSGDAETPLPKIEDRPFEKIDRDDLNRVLAKQKPRLVMRVPNKLTNEGQLGVELKFNSLDDFHPENVARQVEPLRKLLDLRQKLSSLQTSLCGNDKLEQLLREVIKTTEEIRTPRQD